MALPAAWRPAPPPAVTGAAPDAFGMLKALRRRWMLALALGVLVAGAGAAAAWKLLDPPFIAFAQIHVAAARPQVIVSNSSAEPRTDYQYYQKTQASRLKSRYVLTAALKRDEVRRLPAVADEPQPVLWLEDALKVDVKDGSEIVTLSLADADGDEAVTLVNAVMQAYLNEVVNVERDRRTRRVSELQELCDKQREKLRVKRTTLRGMAEQFGTSDSQALTQKQIVLLSSFGELKKQQATVQSELLRARSRLAAYKSRGHTAEDQALLESLTNTAMANDSVAKQHLDRIARFRDVIADYRLNAVDPNEPTMLRATKYLAEEQKALAARRVELRAEVAEQLKIQVASTHGMSLSAQEDEVASLTAQEKALTTEVDRLAREVDKMGLGSTENELLRQDIKQEEKTYEQLSEALEMARLDVRQAPPITPYQEAGLQKRDRKRQILAIALAAIAGLAGVGFCVSWLEVRARRIQSANEVSTGLGMRVMGAVPPLPLAARWRLGGPAEQPDAYGPSFLESIDAVRTVLLRDALIDGHRVVMVTSAVEGEGKTTLASHLAGSLARAGRKTLLVDCDMRRPAAHQLFEVTLHPGLSEALRGEAGLAEAVHPTAIKDLFLLPAGRWDRQVLQSLANDGARAVFDALKRQYDFVVIDSHPVLAANDSLMIGQQADAVIFSILRDRSQSHVVYAACQRLATLGIRMLGAVVHGIDQSEMYGDGYRYSSPARQA